MRRQDAEQLAAFGIETEHTCELPVSITYRFDESGDLISETQIEKFACRPHASEMQEVPVLFAMSPEDEKRARKMLEDERERRQKWEAERKFILAALTEKFEEIRPNTDYKAFTMDGKTFCIEVINP